MGEGRAHPENASQSSEDSLKPPPRLDLARLRPGPGALQPDAFDPLKHDESTIFWTAIDQHFQPFNLSHVRTLRSIPINPYSGMRDQHLRLAPHSDLPDTKYDSKRKDKRESKKLHASPARSEDRKRFSTIKVKPENSLVAFKASSPASSYHHPSSSQPDSRSLVASLNSFPFTHRLVAALLDEAPGKTAAPPMPVIRSNRPNANDDCLWMGIGGEHDIRSYQIALEDRVKIELNDSGLMDTREDDQLQTALRHEQWKLRDTKTMNRVRRSNLYTRVIGTELRRQALDREIKGHNDRVEMMYLERLVKSMKKNKKARSRIQKLLQRLFGHYKEKEKQIDKNRKAVEALSNGRMLTNGEEKSRSSIKKKKKKNDPKGFAASLTNGNVSRGGVH